MDRVRGGGAGDDEGGGDAIGAGSVDEPGKAVDVVGAHRAPPAVVLALGVAALAVVRGEDERRHKQMWAALVLGLCGPQRGEEGCYGESEIAHLTGLSRDAARRGVMSAQRALKRCGVEVMRAAVAEGKATSDE